MVLRQNRVVKFSELKLNDDGLIPVIVQDVESKIVLMMAWMNEIALSRTLNTKRATYWSRSRQCYWVKGETSGHVQEVVAAYLDCDNDTILLSVKQTGPACHTFAQSCFFQDISDDGELQSRYLKNLEQLDVRP